jgi:tape measure domain-containing protein
VSDVIDSGVIEVALDLSSIDKQLAGLSSDISGAVEKGFSGVGGKAAASLTGGLKKGLGAIQQGISVSMSAVGIAAGGALATSLYKGFSRYTTIEDSLISMETQLGSATRAATMLDEVLDVVRGTPFNLDQFADAASRMVSFGAEAEKIPGYLEAIGEVSATKGGRANEFAMRLSTSFGQIAAMGRITNEEINQMSQAGVPAIRILANEFDVTTVQAKEMISEGIIPANEAMDALTKGILEGSNGLAGATPAMAGTMEGLRDTMTGALGGMQSAMARFGAEIVSQLAPGLTAVFNATAAVWDKLTSSIEGFKLDESGAMQTIIEFLDRIADSDSGALDSIFETLQGMASLAAPLAAMAGAKGLGALAGIIPGLGAAIGPLTGGIGTLVIGLGALLATNEEFMASLGGLGSMLMDSLSPLLDMLVGPLVGLMDVLGEAVAGLVGMLVPIIGAMMTVLTPILDIIIELAAVILEQMVPFFDMWAEMLQRVMPYFQMLGESIGEMSAMIGPLIEAAFAPFLLYVEMLLPMVEMFIIMLVSLQAMFTDILVALMPIVLWLADMQMAFMKAVTESDAFLWFMNQLADNLTAVAEGAAWAAEKLDWALSLIGMGKIDGGINAEMTALAEANERAAETAAIFTDVVVDATSPAEAFTLALNDATLATAAFNVEGRGLTGFGLADDAPKNFIELANAIDGFGMEDFSSALEDGEDGLAQLAAEMAAVGVPAGEIQFTMEALGIVLNASSEAFEEIDFGENQAIEAREALNLFNEEIVLFLDQLEGIKSIAFGDAVASEFATGESSFLSMQMAAWDTQDVFDNFKGALEGVGGWAPDGTTFDATRDGARELYEAALPLQQMLGEDLMEAYDAANSDPLVDGLSAAQDAAEDFGAEMAAGLGIEEGTAEFEEFLKVLGATPEQVETTVKVADADVAEQKIALLGDVIGGLPTEIQQTVTAQIMEDDYVGALATAEAAVADGVDTPIIPLTPEVDTVVEEMTAKFAANPPDVPVTVVKPDEEILNVISTAIVDGVGGPEIVTLAKAPPLGDDQYALVNKAITDGIGDAQVTVKLNYVRGSGQDLLNETTRNMTVGTGADVGAMGVGTMSGNDYSIARAGGGREVNMVKIEDATFMDGIDLDELAAQVRLGMVLAGETV